MTGRIDWSAVVGQLLKRMSYRQLHRCTGMSLGKLHSLANGHSPEPPHSSGERLLELQRTCSEIPETSNVHTMNS